MKKCILVTAALSLFGCVSMGGPAFVKDEFIAPDTAVIYVFRPMSLIGFGECYRVGVDSTYLGCLKAGGHYRLETSPGLHQSWTTSLLSDVANADDCQKDTGCRQLEQSLQGGQAYYLQLEPFEFQFQKEAVGLPAVSKTKRQATVK